MGSLAIAFLGVAVAALLMLPRPWAALPLLAAGVCLPTGAALDVGGFSFYALRVLLAAALLRIVIRREGLNGPMHALDGMMCVWAAAALVTSLFHDDVAAAWVNRLGLVYTAGGLYVVLRIFCSSNADRLLLCRIVAIVLIPLALGMFAEKLNEDNLFALFGGIDAAPEIRGATVRAQGPFAHSILAGSVGAASLPLMVALWKTHRVTAAAGISACLTMVFCAGSSGPIMSLAFAVLALLLWPWRAHMRAVRWGIVAAYIGLEIVMNAPAYYLLTRIDFTGNSTSWYRAALIEAAFANLSEWWIVGTDYTRNWMPSGVPWSGNHTDITNYYLRMGVDGGLPLMLSFIAVLAMGFSFVGRAWRQEPAAEDGSPFVAWAFGSALFTHVATFMAVSYFDQSVVFLYLTLAAIGSMAPGPSRSPAEASFRSASALLGHPIHRHFR